MSDLNFKIETVKRKRERAITSKTSSLAYRYSLEMNPPIAIEEVIEIEKQYSIKFPAEYRAFITTIANGGFGPNFGLLSIERSLQWLYGEILQDKIDYDYLKIPFIHTSAYNPYDDPYLTEMSDKCDRGEISESEFDLVYSSVYDYSTAGTITISLEGCGYNYFLVVTGATRGQVWFNADVGDGRYIPLNLSFLDWYEQWLDEYFYLKE